MYALAFFHAYQSCSRLIDNLPRGIQLLTFLKGIALSAILRVVIVLALLSFYLFIFILVGFISQMNLGSFQCGPRYIRRFTLLAH